MLLSTPQANMKSITYSARSPVVPALQPPKGHPKRASRTQRRGGLMPVLVRSSGQQQTATTTVATEQAAAAPQGKFEITLRGQEAYQTVRLGLVPQGRGQAVVVTQVVEGSKAEQLGVRRGQKLVALSDPMRYGTMWSLEDRPSLRFVVDTFKMRRAAPIDLEFEPLVGEADMDAIFGAPSQSAPASGSEPDVVVEGARAAAPGPGSAGSSSSSSGGAVDMSPDDALGSLSSIDQMMGAGSGEGETIADRLAAQYAAQQRARMAVNQVQKRIERRKAYMEIDDQRDDTGLLLGLAAAFLLPALVILVVAYFSGYLDRLYLEALTLR